MSELQKMHIESLFVEYKDVIETFSEKRIQDRYHRLLVSAQEFIKEMNYTGHVVCNETLLMLVVLAYFSDIKRLKEFHEIERANDSKIFAYEASWLLKLRPLQIIDSNNQKYTFCNEQFVYSEIQYWLRKNEEKDGATAILHTNLKFFSDTLFYHLTYRNNNPQTLELMLVAFLAGRHYQDLVLMPPDGDKGED